MQQAPLRPDGTPWVLNTVAISVPGATARVLIDMVNPDDDALVLATNFLDRICKTAPERWIVQVVGQTEYEDLIPGGTRLPHQAN